MTVESFTIPVELTVEVSREDSCRHCLCVAEDHPVRDEQADDGTYECEEYTPAVTTVTKWTVLPLEAYAGYFGPPTTSHGRSHCEHAGQYCECDPPISTDDLWKAIADHLAGRMTITAQWEA